MTEAGGAAVAEGSPREPSPPVPAAGGAGSAATGSAAEAAATGRPLWPVFLGLAALIAVADQATKAWLVSFLDRGESVDVVGDWIRLVHSQNAGGLFGLLQGQALPFGLVSIVVVAMIVVYHASAGHSRYLSITLGLLLGGALGNLIDRLRLGYVVDFVDAGIGDLRWYTFNVADAGISFALLLLIAASIRPSVARRTAPDA